MDRETQALLAGVIGVAAGLAFGAMSWAVGLRMLGVLFLVGGLLHFLFVLYGWSN